MGAIEPWFYENLCRLLGREDFIEDQRAEGEVQEQRIRAFQEIFRRKTRDEWVAELMDADTCVAPVYSVEEVARDPHLRERGSVVDAPDPEKGKRPQVGVIFKLSETPAAIRRPPPQVGQDTRSVLRELGYDDAAIEEMAAAGGF